MDAKTKDLVDNVVHLADLAWLRARNGGGEDLVGAYHDLARWIGHSPEEWPPWPVLAYVRHGRDRVTSAVRTYLDGRLREGLLVDGEDDEVLDPTCMDGIMRELHAAIPEIRDADGNHLLRTVVEWHAERHLALCVHALSSDPYRRARELLADIGNSPRKGEMPEDFANRMSSFHADRLARNAGLVRDPYGTFGRALHFEAQYLATRLSSES